MAQFDVYINTNPNSKSIYPYIIDIQSSLLESLDTRLVIPLIQSAKFGDKAIKNLTPSILVKGQSFFVLSPQIAAIHKKNLGKLVENCISYRQTIISSVDFLITGF